MKKAKYLDAHGAKERRRMIIQRSGTKQGEPRREYTSFRVKSTRNKAVPDDTNMVLEVTSHQ